MDKVPSALKAFVIAAGVILVVGTILLAALLILRATGSGEVAQVVQVADTDVALPAGARVQQVVPDGGRVILLGIDAAGRQFLAIIDAETGERLRLIRIRPDGG